MNEVKNSDGLPPIIDGYELCREFDKRKFSMDDDHKHKFPMIARKRWVDVPVSSYGYCGYVIEYKRMDSPEKLLGWIHHLCEKCNLTTEHIWQLIEIAKDRGVKIDFNS